MSFNRTLPWSIRVNHAMHTNVLSTCLWHDFFNFSGPLFVVVEFACHGNLRQFLRERRPSRFHYQDSKEALPKEILTVRDFISYAYQVARGMEYLATRKVTEHNNYIPFNPSSANSWSKANFSFQFMAGYVWYSMEKLAGDLLFGLKLMKLSIFSTLIHAICLAIGQLDIWA